MALPEKYKTKSWIIVGTALSTVLLVVIIVLVVKIFSPSSVPVAAVSQTQTETDLKIKGNRSSRIYHLPGCPNYDDIAERNIVWFKTHEEAKAAGFRMAKNC